MKKLLTLFFFLCIVQFTFGQVTKIELQRQPDNRIYIRLGYQTESSFGTQHAGAFVKNNTSDDLGIKLNITVHLNCGSSFSYNAGIDGLLNLKGGKETDASFWFDANFMSREAVKEYEKLCGKRKEGQKSVISGVSCSLIGIENYSQKKREEQARREKEEAERKRLADEKAKQEAEQKRQKEEQKRLANEKAKQEAENQRLAVENSRRQSTNNLSQDGSVGTITASSASKVELPRKDFVPGNLSVEQYRSYPEEFKTNDGKYIKKDNGHLVYISEQEYNERKNDRKAKLELQGVQARAKLQEEQNRSAQAAIDNIRRQEQETIARNERSNAYMQQASYYGAQASYAKEMRIEASSFQQTHTNLSSLEAEYNAKLRQLAVSAEAEQQATSSTYSAVAASIAEAGWGNSEISQSAGQLGAAIGGIIASSRADKARKELAEERKRQAAAIAKVKREYEEAIAKAKKEQEEAEQKLRAEAVRARQQAIIALRKQLATTFIDGGMPLQNHNVTQPEVYVFAYSSSKNDWDTANSSVIMVSNIIPIYKMNDGTFPYKNAVLKTLTPLGNVDDITVIGFFTNKSEIEEIRTNFIASVQKAEFHVKNINIKIKENSNTIKQSSKDDDFWETGQSPTKTKQNTVETSFWN